MGLFGALFAGVSGLDSQSNKIGIISNNISNVNTVGYKQSAASFDTLVVPSGTTAFSPGGVIGNNQSLINQQGLIQATSSSTDVAISGGGLLVVNTAANGSGNTYYTRSGSFTQDASGNFVNANGYFLQGLPVLADGDTAQATTQNLTTVNVGASATGKATPTTAVTIAANFNAAQTTFPGASVNATMSTLNGTSAVNTNQTATQIIVGNDYGTDSVNNIKRGNSFTILSGAPANKTDTFIYGGYTVGRNINSTGNSNNGDGANTLLTTSDIIGGGFTAYDAGYVPTTSTQAITNINVADTATSVVGPNGLFAAGTLNFGAASILLTTGETLTQIKNALQNSLTTNGDTGTISITGNAGNFALTGVDTASTTATFSGFALTGGTSTPTYTVGTATKSPANNQVSFSVSSANITDGAYTVGGYVSVTGATAIAGTSLTANDINGEQRIVSINGTTVTVALSDGATNSTVGTVASAAGGGTAATVNNRTFNFAGNILDATSPSTDFLGTSQASSFASDSLKFTVTVGGNTASTFTYSTTPDASTGTFNSLDSLATAINDAPGLTARVQDGRLYVSAQDANQQVIFANGDATGTTSGTTNLPGINWVQELGLGTLPAAAANTYYFNSVAGLASKINTVDPTDLSATVANASGAASLTITEANPEQTVNFSDAQTPAHGSLLAELGFTTKGGAIKPDTQTGFNTTSTLGITYSPASPTTDMSSGAVTPQYSHDITVYDSQGNSHTIAMNVVKLGTNTWGMELTAVPASDTVSSVKNAQFPNGDGQIASGTITFNGSGAISSVTGTLASSNIQIPWTNGSDPSTIAVNLGLGTTTGLSQASGAFNVSTANQNGSPTGQLTGVNIDANGFVIATFSNGQTQKMFQVPLANVSNPDGMQSVSGDAYTQTLASGIPNLQIAGTSGVGTFTPSALEQSNVDLSTQLTDLIVAQQAYGANSKVLTIADQLLQQLDQIIQ